MCRIEGKGRKCLLETNTWPCGWMVDGAAHKVFWLNTQQKKKKKKERWFNSKTQRDQPSKRPWNVFGGENSFPGLVGPFWRESNRFRCVKETHSHGRGRGKL